MEFISRIYNKLPSFIKLPFSKESKAKKVMEELKNTQTGRSLAGSSENLKNRAAIIKDRTEQTIGVINEQFARTKYAKQNETLVRDLDQMQNEQELREYLGKLHVLKALNGNKKVRTEVNPEIKDYLGLNRDGWTRVQRFASREMVPPNEELTHWGQLEVKKDGNDATFTLTYNQTKKVWVRIPIDELNRSIQDYIPHKKVIYGKEI